MKKVLLSIAVFVVSFASAFGQQKTNVTIVGSTDTSVSKVITSQVGNGTAQIMTTVDADGNAITVIPIWKKGKVQGWDITFAKDGEIKKSKSYSKQKYQDYTEALKAAYSDYNSSYRTSGYNGTLGNVYGRTVFIPAGDSPDPNDPRWKLKSNGQGGKQWMYDF